MKIPLINDLFPTSELRISESLKVVGQCPNLCTQKPNHYSTREIRPKK